MRNQPPAFRAARSSRRAARRVHRRSTRARSSARIDAEARVVARIRRSTSTKVPGWARSQNANAGASLHARRVNFASGIGEDRLEERLPVPRILSREGIDLGMDARFDTLLGGGALELIWRLEDMRNEGVVVFPTPAEGTSGIANYYQSSNMETRICKPIGFGGKYSINEIPGVEAKVIMLSPLFAGEVDLDLLKLLAKRAPVSLDIQGTVAGTSGGWAGFPSLAGYGGGIKQITYLKVDRSEAEFLTGITDLRKAARALHAIGPEGDRSHPIIGGNCLC